MEIKLSELQWDTFNTIHIVKHNVSKLEVIQACNNKIYTDKTYGDRYLLVGMTKSGRYISVVLASFGINKYYVVTARDSSKGERKKAHDFEKK